MKKIISLVLIMLSVGFVALAQQTPKKETRQDRKRTELVDKTAEEIAKKRTDRIDKKVDLTEEQRKEVYAYYLKEAKATIAEEQKASEADTTVSKGSKKQRKDEVHKLLTPEQQKKLSDKKGKNKTKTKKRS